MWDGVDRTQLANSQNGCGDILTRFVAEFHAVSGRKSVFLSVEAAAAMGMQRWGEARRQAKNREKDGCRAADAVVVEFLSPRSRWVSTKSTFLRTRSSLRHVGPWTRVVKIREKRTLLRDFGSCVRAGALSGGKLTLACCRWKPQTAWRSPTQLGKRPALRTRPLEPAPSRFTHCLRVTTTLQRSLVPRVESRECLEFDGERGTEGRGS